MFDYHSEHERRVAQFAGYLKPMNHRAHVIANASCFIIFDENRPSDEPKLELGEKRDVVLSQAGDAFGSSVFGDSPLDEIVSMDLPYEGWRGSNSEGRFIQFSMENKWFCMDMPLHTLYRPEAEEILRRRHGFFYLEDRKEFTLGGELVEGCDPFRKIYMYSDEESAADDMAFIFFQVWKFPIDSRLFVTSASFNGKHYWERGVPTE